MFLLGPEGQSYPDYSRRLSQAEFLQLSRSEVAEIVGQRGKPKNVALVVDGTRRMLQLTSHLEDVYSYEHDPSNEMRQLMEKSVETGDLLFDMGVEFVTGPLATMGNLTRPGFIPYGLKLLLDPLTGDDTLRVLEKHQASLHFYGDMDYIRTQEGGEIIDQYITFFENINPTVPRHRVLVGLGISTKSDLVLSARAFSEFKELYGKEPSVEELREYRFGFPVPPIDIFVRTNEVKLSGCLDPLLQSDETQFYFPVSPGILSLEEPVIRTVLHDYLYNRAVSGGKHVHQVLTQEEIHEVLKYYDANKTRVLGVGRQIGGDIWISD